MDGSPVTPETSYKFKAVTAGHTISATFAINTYTITSSAGAHGSISPASPTVNYGADQPFTITPETGYHVETLTVDAAAVTPATSYTFRNVTAAHTISAAFAINTYTLTYTAGANGTISGTSPQTVNYASNATTVTAVPATGYHFVSWSDGATTAARRDTNVTANLSVTATFAINTYTLTYTAGAHGTITGASPQYGVPYGGSGTLVTAVPDIGYHFVSWSDGVSTAARSEANVTADKSVTASFAINTYTITSSAGAHGSISPASPTVNYGADQPFTITPETGYHVASLVVDGSPVTPATAYTFTNVTAPHTITATFAINTYTLTYTAGANGTISGTTPQAVNHGSNGSAVTAVADPGYHFVSWSDGVATATRSETGVTGDKSVTATFAINTYTLTYTAGSNGTISGTSPQTDQPRLERHDRDRGACHRLPLRELVRRREHRRAQGHQRDRHQDGHGDLRDQHLHPGLHRGRQRERPGHHAPGREPRLERDHRDRRRRHRLPLRELVRRSDHGRAQGRQRHRRQERDGHLRHQHLHADLHGRCERFDPGHHTADGELRSAGHGGHRGAGHGLPLRQLV